MDDVAAVAPVTTPARRRLPVIARYGAIAAAVYGIGRLSARRLASFPYPLDVAAAWTGARVAMPATLPAALVTLAVVTVAVAAVAWSIHRHTRELTAGECVAGAVCVLWCAAYLA